MFLAKKSKSVIVSTCRVCLKTVDQSGSSLSENNDLLKLFIYCTGISVLPHNAERVCSKCEYKIRDYADFKTMCIESNDIWNSFEEEKCCIDKLPEDEMPQNMKHEVEENDFCDNNYSFSCDDEPPDIKEKSQPLSVLPPNVNVNNSKRIVKNVRKTKVQDSTKPKRLIQTSVSRHCGLCEFTTKSKEELRNHLAVHWSSDDFKCIACGITSRDAAELLTHRYSHSSVGKCKFVCHICDKICASVLSVEFHYRSVHLETPGGFCALCRKSFITLNTWKKHLRWHNNEKFTCDHCGKKFLYRYEIESHLIDHSDKRDFICETCGKTFKRKSNLKIHVASVHSTKSVKCDHCNKVFKSHITYNDHIKVLKAEKPYPCTVCGKSYHLESALRSHMFWHSGEKPHVCKVCGLKYKGKGQLKIHERNHTGYLPYKCKECDKCFNNSQSLKRHQSVHTGRRAHKCLYCERTFHMRKSVREHCASAHKDKLNGESDSVVD